MSGEQIQALIEKLKRAAAFAPKVFEDRVYWRRPEQVLPVRCHTFLLETLGPRALLVLAATNITLRLREVTSAAEALWPVADPAAEGVPLRAVFDVAWLSVEFGTSLDSRDPDFVSQVLRLADSKLGSLLNEMDEVAHRGVFDLSPCLLRIIRDHGFPTAPQSLPPPTIFKPDEIQSIKSRLLGRIGDLVLGTDPLTTERIVMGVPAEQVSGRDRSQLPLARFFGALLDIPPKPQS